MIGFRESEVLRVFDELGVVRQAYHGNIFVGNHCRIILKNFVM